MFGVSGKATNHFFKFISFQICSTTTDVLQLPSIEESLDDLHVASSQQPELRENLNVMLYYKIFHNKHEIIMS